MHRYTYKEIVDFLTLAERKNIEKAKVEGLHRDERQFAISSVFTIRDIKKLLKEDWIKKCQK